MRFGVPLYRQSFRSGMCLILFLVRFSLVFWVVLLSTASDMFFVEEGIDHMSSALKRFLSNLGSYAAAKSCDRIMLLKSCLVNGSFVAKVGTVYKHVT